MKKIFTFVKEEKPPPCSKCGGTGWIAIGIPCGLCNPESIV